MALSIKDPEATQLAHLLAKQMGTTLTEAVASALREKLAGEQRRMKAKRENLVEEMLAIGRRCAARPVLDNRSEDEILGYDEHGIPSL